MDGISERAAANGDGRSTIDRIEAIGIRDDGSLWVRPASTRFPQMYREGMGVGWDEVRGCLYSPPPREWSHLQWFHRIIQAAVEQGISLVVTDETEWRDIEPSLRDELRLGKSFS